MARSGCRQALPLSPLERAAGLPLGTGDGPPTLDLPDAGVQDPLAAMEEAVLGALARPPCLVSFSGGRDSSAVLAVATKVARREGLPDPVPVSWRFPGVASTEESGWQELVVSHVGSADWNRLTIDQELDLLGDVAQASLTSHGLLWPPNAYFHVPILDLATGGSVLTGVDGDGLLGGWRWARAQAVLHGVARPGPRDPFRIGLALAPPWVRRLRSGLPPPPAWLRPDAARQAHGVLAAESASEPRRWDARLAWYGARRYLRLGLHSLELLARARDVQLRHPLYSLGFIAALARDGGAAGYGDRTAAMQRLFGGLLPPSLLGRRTKAEFGRAVWRDEARSFVARWTGEGVDPLLVEPETLRAIWESTNPPLAAATLLHGAWLATQRQ